MGSASEDLIAVLALHLLAVAILALGDAVDVAPDFGLRAGEDFHRLGHPERGANDLWLVAFSFPQTGTNTSAIEFPQMGTDRANCRKILR